MATSKYFLDTDASSVIKNKLVVGLCGLPGRGKSYVAQKMNRYLNWLGYQANLFNVSSYRRKYLGVGHVPAEFYSYDNPEGVRVRHMVHRQAHQDMIHFLKNGGEVAIIDATHSQVSQRQALVDAMQVIPNVEVLWMELIASKGFAERMLLLHHSEHALTPERQINQDNTGVLDEFRRKIGYYQDSYQTITDNEKHRYCKLIDNGKKVITFRCNGYLITKLVQYCMHLRVNKHPIWMSRHGQSVYNTKGRLGGDTSLSEAGERYAKALGIFSKTEAEIVKHSGRFLLWCSTLQRTILTASAVERANPKVTMTEWPNLVEIDTGVFDGYTYKEIQDQQPNEFKARSVDKLNYRYPHGESYRDVIDRLEPVIFELERAAQPVLIVGHQAVLRCIYGYFIDNVPLDKLPRLSIPLHTVIKLSPMAYGCREERFKYETKLDRIVKLEEQTVGLYSSNNSNTNDNKINSYNQDSAKDKKTGNRTSVNRQISSKITSFKHKHTFNTADNVYVNYSINSNL